MTNNVIITPSFTADLIADVESAFGPKKVKPEGKKMGVWVNGKLKLQTRDRANIDAAAAKWMREGNDVWVAPIGSFVTV